MTVSEEARGEEAPLLRARVCQQWIVTVVSLGSTPQCKRAPIANMQEVWWMFTMPAYLQSTALSQAQQMELVAHEIWAHSACESMV